MLNPPEDGRGHAGVINLPVCVRDRLPLNLLGKINHKWVSTVICVCARELETNQLRGSDWITSWKLGHWSPLVFTCLDIC